MNRSHRTLCLALVAVLALPRPAAAGRSFWAWLEELSGAGPFKGRTYLLTACVQDRHLKPSPISADAKKFRTMTPSQRRDARDEKGGAVEPSLACVYFDQGFFTADADATFPIVKARLTDFGGTIRVIDGLDVGAGIGRVSFSANGSHSGKLTFTPIRVVMRPLLVGVPWEYRRRWMGVFGIYFKETFVKGPLDGTDFGVDAARFASKSELVRSVGLHFDLTALCPAKYCGG